MLYISRNLFNLPLKRALPFLRHSCTLVQPGYKGIYIRHGILRSSSGLLGTTAQYLIGNTRFYNPARHIDWVGIKRRWRSKQLFMKNKKLKNHPRVALRFRLTRFGWERLQQGRGGRKSHMSRQKRRNKKRVKFVSRHDLVKLTRQMPGHRLRIRDAPINNNPNIQRLRATIKGYFA